MKRRILILTLILLLIVNAVPLIAYANYTPPSSFGKPKNLAVIFNSDDLETSGYYSFYIGYSASDEIRALVDAYDDGLLEGAGFSSLGLYVQIDYKLDNGTWRYDSNWDENYTPTDLNQGAGIWKGTYATSNSLNSYVFTDIFTDEKIPGGKSYFDNHTLHFRLRFYVSYFDEVNSISHKYFSPWSDIASYNNNQKIYDTAALINHPPKLKSADLKLDSDGSPYLVITADKAHDDTTMLNSISHERVNTNVWVRINGGEWKDTGTYSFFIERFNVEAKSFFESLKNIDAAVYEVKFRYEFDNYYYPAGGKSGVIYSPFSNVISHGMPSYSGASNWAIAELDRAVNYGFITEKIKDDMKAPITREEFAELAVKLYEKYTGKSAAPAALTTFVDTQNPEIFKAFNLKIVNGVNTEKKLFAPKDLTNREQVAAMLYRAVAAIEPSTDFSTAGAEKFNDDHLISNWAMESVKFMSKNEFIKGSNGRFDPKGTCTREMAVLIAVRVYEKYSGISQ